MSNPLQRLIKTKFTLLAVICTVVGTALLLPVRWSMGQSGWAWLSNLPISELGAGLFTTGLFGVLFQYVGQRDAEEQAPSATDIVAEQDH